ncbi:MAG: hypothetical protein ACK4SL_04160 [Candidatus Paceibacteria bacterium]
MKYLVFVTLFFVSIVGQANAQFDTGFVDQTSGISVSLSPTYPAPGERVTATLDDYAIGSAFSTITWFLNGTEVSVAKNSRMMTFVAPALGEKLTITVKLTLPSGLTIEASQSITPLYTDVIVEPQTYIPRQYQGRALPSIGSLVRATALVQDENGFINPALHSYVWKLNGTAVGGGGRNNGFQVEYVVPYGRNHTLTVEVYDRTGQMLTRRGTNIQTEDVDLVLYEVNPLYGKSNIAIGGQLQFLSNTLQLRAVPYNLDLRSTPQNTFSEWRLGNRAVASDTTSPFDLTLERTGQGKIPVNFKLRNRDALLQGGEVSTSLNFGL